MSSPHNVYKVRKKLDEVSPSFCVAKWKQVTIHLHSGHTHSCHHPPTHKIPVKEVIMDPGALHNTFFKKKQRRMMLQGKRPPECSYCWNIEDLSEDHISDRVYKSASAWAESHLEECSKMEWHDDVYPSYVELNFSNTCNLMCSYCSPHCSSKWYEEIRKHGAYPTSTKTNSLSHFDKLIRAPIKEDDNPYIEAWNKWWPDLKPHLKVLRITGGEPLLSKHTFKTMDDLIENPQPQLELAINSNLCVPPTLINKFLDRVPALSDGAIKKFEVFTSVDTWGEDAEYIRHGFNLEQFKNNVCRVLNKSPKVRLTFMCTYNALSPFKFRSLLVFILWLRKNYPENYILLDISYLRHPTHQSVKVLDGRANELIKDDIDFMRSKPIIDATNSGIGFFSNEIQKLERIYQYVQEESDPKQLKKDQKDFFAFFAEHDKRRKTDFFKTFPQFKDFEKIKKFKGAFSPTNAAEISNMGQRMKEIEKISPSMCSAKWLQSTLHLHNGFTHSCHHPAPHKIPMAEIAQDPSALHNTQFKKSQRDLMLKGERPSECEYCWNIEDLGKDYISDRTYKSTNKDWSVPFLDRINTNNAQTNVDPSYLEVSFSNACNFKCAYCSPEISSKWMEETKKHGSIALSEFNLHDLKYMDQINKKPYGTKEFNPYVEAFWKWWPQLYPSLNTFRITGGEPLLSKDTWDVLDYIEYKPRKDFSLIINSNLGISDALVKKLVDYHNRISPNIKSFEVYTSLESIGKQAEYARYGLDYDHFLKNVHYLLSETSCKVHFMVTFNVLSIPSFKSYLELIYDLRKRYNTEGSLNRIPMMIAYLRWPQMLDMRIAPKEIKEHYTQMYLDFAKNHSYENQKEDSHNGYFYLEEMNQLERLCQYMLETPDKLDTQLKDFKMYIKELDQRRDLDFSKTFPELKDLNPL